MAFKGVDTTGTVYTALCGDFFGIWSGIDCRRLNDNGLGYLYVMLHELSHHMQATEGWGVDDGPSRPGRSCQGVDCLLEEASFANCPNVHNADAYAHFAAAVNCSVGGVRDLPARQDWTGVPAGYLASLPQEFSSNTSSTSSVTASSWSSSSVVSTSSTMSSVTSSAMPSQSPLPPMQAPPSPSNATQPFEVCLKPSPPGVCAAH